MEQEWITDRLPTEADGDIFGDVRIQQGPGSSNHCIVHWGYVGAGVPWQRTGGWQPRAEAEPTEPDRIAALEVPNVGPAASPAKPTRRVVQIAFGAVDGGTVCLSALCSDGSMWCLHATNTEWTELPAIPQP